MPLMNGIDTTKEVKNLIFKGIIPDLPILVSSGDDFSLDWTQFGFDGFIRKPYNKNLLLDTIDKLLNKK